MTHSKLPAHTCTTTTMPSPHHMANLTFHFGTRRLVVGLPRVSLLMLPVLMKHLVHGVDVYGPTPFGRGALLTTGTGVTVVTKLRNAAAVFSGLDRGGLARWADHRTSSLIDGELVLSKAAESRRWSLDSRHGFDACGIQDRQDLGSAIGTVTVDRGLQLKTQGVRIGPVPICVGSLRRGDHGGSRSLQDADKYPKGHKEMPDSAAVVVVADFGGSISAINSSSSTPRIADRMSVTVSCVATAS